MHSDSLLFAVNWEAQSARNNIGRDLQSIIKKTLVSKDCSIKTHVLKPSALIESCLCFWQCWKPGSVIALVIH